MRLGLRVLRMRLPRVSLVVRHIPAGTGFKRSRLVFTGRESILVLAPHCDDETLGAGALLYETAQLGCQVRVVFVTNGDGFGYAANRQYLKLLVTPEKRIEFAYLRQRESLRALSALGIQPAEVIFLGYPDRGLQALWNEAWSPGSTYRSPFTGAECSPYRNSYTPNAPYCGWSLAKDLRQLIAETKPTHIIVPHPRDAHGDHTATFCFALQALEQLRSSSMTQQPQILTYLVHRGTWPYPRGLHPHLDMHPPFSFAGLRENWTSFSPSSDAVAAKHRAVLQYRTQLNLGRKFLLSFIRRSELFGFFSPTQVHSVSQGAVFVDGSVGEWPKGVGYLPDPVRDTITRNVERGADVRSVAVCADPGYLFVRLEMYGRVAEEARYTVRLASCHEDSRRINMRLVAPDRVVVRQAHQWVVSKDIICRSSGNRFELAIPRALIGTSDRVILGVETRYRQIMVDRTAWTLLVLPSQSESEGAIVFSTASESDLAGVADVFVGAFEKEVKNTLGENPQYDVVRHLFELMHRAEPQALFVARNAKGIVGYVYAPSSLQKVWHTALVEGHLWRWFTNWVRGRYPIRLAAARTLLVDKYFLVRSSVRDRSRSQHRILSVGVKPEAQGEGIASRLVQQAITRFERMGAPSIRLEVRPQNKAALRVYEKLGFVVRSSMYDSRGEWWVMTKELSPHTDDAPKPLDPVKHT